MSTHDPNPISLPTEGQCLRLMAREKMPEHIAAHSRQVCRVALFLRRAMGASHLNTELIQASALLHDITKSRSIETGERHSDTGGELVRDWGYPEVGEIVRQHVRLDQYDPVGPVTEAEIVNYADKRVIHDRIVTLEKRRAYILKRYGTRPEYRRAIQKTWELTARLERKIFSAIAFPPDALAAILGESEN